MWDFKRETYFFCSFCSPFSCSSSLMRWANLMTLCDSNTRQGVRSAAIEALLMWRIWCSFNITMTSSSFNLRCFSNWSQSLQHLQEIPLFSIQVSYYIAQYCSRCFTFYFLADNSSIEHHLNFSGKHPALVQLIHKYRI